MNEQALWMQNPIFAAAGGEVCSMLPRFYPARRYAPGDKIVGSGEPLDLHVLLEGCVRVFHQNPDGLEITVKLLRAPVVYGDIEIFHGLPFLESVAAVDEALVARIPAADYDRFLDQHPLATKEHLKHLSAAFCVAARNEQQLFASLDRRIANLILAYVRVDEHGPRLGDKPAVALSQETIAQSLGVVRRSVAGVLSAWTKEGVLRKRGAHLVLEQPEVLEELCAPIANSLPYWIGIPLEPLGDGGEQPRVATLELVEGPSHLIAPRTLVDGELVIGREPACGLIVPADGVAARHCRVFRSARGGRFWVQALSTTTTTRLNGKEVQRAVLRDGDLLELGEVRFRIGLPA